MRDLPTDEPRTGLLAAWSPTLRTRLTLGLVALVGTTALFLFLYVPAQVERHLVQGIEARARAMAELAASAVARPAFMGDREAADRALDVLRSQPGVRYAVAVDAGDRSLAAFQPFEADRLRFRSVDAAAEPDRADVFRTFATGTTGGQAAGGVYLGVSLLEARQTLARTRSHVAVVSILVLVAGLLGAIAIQGLVTAPIARIRRTVERVAAGALDQRVGITTRDELGFLARSFDAMVARLEQAHAELRTSNRRLEQRVLERTRELQRGIEEREALEEQFRQSQKLEAIGRLAGGIAHDFNNLLTTINGLADLLLADGVAEPRVHDDLVEIRKAGDRAARLTQQLLAFSRRQVLQLEVIDANAVILDMSAMLQRLVGSGIAFDLALDGDLHAIRSDPGQIGQVVMNLVVNARDAMPDGGVLHIGTRNRTLDTIESARLGTAAPGPFIELIVEDDGLGMDEATRERIFEPFFTTRSGQGGTGLGLATVHGIVHQSGGAIAVDSEPGRGSRFAVYLPSLGRREPGMTGAADAEGAPGSETVLVVEDEDAVRDLVGRVLRKTGYRVLESHDGNHALELFRAHNGTIDAIVTDVIMPHMSGPEMVREISRQRPDLPVLYMSGHTRDEVLDAGADGGARAYGFIQKPMSPHALARKLRDLLDARATAA